MAVTIGISLAIEIAIYLASYIAVDAAVDIAVEIANDLTIDFTIENAIDIAFLMAIDRAVDMAIDIAIDIALLDFCGRIILIDGGSGGGVDELYQIGAAGRNLLSVDEPGVLHPCYNLRALAAVDAQKAAQIRLKDAIRS
jgi:hypothetical protein